ncbi:MAG: lytic transglycosylase domain-containing protein [Verrucomicrobiae bacterium]|nr:lytic transglycosylase domain-containing protein [Verrucomicrobiae bacterium]
MKKSSKRILGLLVGSAVCALVGVILFERRLEHSQDKRILEAARLYDVDPALVKAVMWRESRFRPAARGRAGEVGLMQLTDAAAQEWAESAGVYPVSETQLLDPRTNTLAGAWYLSKLIRRYQRADDPLPYALADYNAGRANVSKWAEGQAATNSASFIQRITYPGTRSYVLSVLEKRKRYARDFNTFSDQRTTKSGSRAQLLTTHSNAAKESLNPAR